MRQTLSTITLIGCMLVLGGTMGIALSTEGTMTLGSPVQPSNTAPPAITGPTHTPCAPDAPVCPPPWEPDGEMMLFERPAGPAPADVPPDIRPPTRVPLATVTPDPNWRPITWTNRCITIIGTDTWFCHVKIWAGTDGWGTLGVRAFAGYDYPDSNVEEDYWEMWWTFYNVECQEVAAVFELLVGFATDNEIYVVQKHCEFMPEVFR